jgi:hypothetical protein
VARSCFSLCRILTRLFSDGRQCKVAEGVGSENPISVGLRSEAGNIMQLDTEPAFLIKSIAPNSTNFLAFSTHVVRIQMNADVVSYQSDRNLKRFSKESTPSLVITGIIGSLTPSNLTLSVGGRDSYLFRNQTAVWNQSQGTLRLFFADLTILRAFSTASFSFELQNPSGKNVAQNVQIRLDGALVIQTTPMDGVAVLSENPANFSYLFSNFTSRVRGGPTLISVFLEASTDIQPSSNITVSGIRGSSTAATENLTIFGPLATRFTSGYYVNRTNTSSGYVKNGVVRGVFLLIMISPHVQPISYTCDLQCLYGRYHQPVTNSLG